MTEFDTNLIHAKPQNFDFKGAVATPIFQSSTYKYGAKAEYDDIKYARLNNSPNHDLLHHKLASIEGAEAALVTSSGMSAISTSLLTLLSAGDHLLIQNCVYGGTYGFVVQDLPRLGITFDFFNPHDLNDLRAKCKANTRAIYLEAISNPLLEVVDFAGVVAFAREKKLVTLIDNTYATPVNFQPSKVGIDVSLHSCSKQMNGHSDLVAGAIIGKKEFIKPIGKVLNKLGGCLDPHACFLLERGMKTLAVRVRQQNESALKIARFLEQDSRISSVNYPGLPDNSQYKIAREYFSGFGCMLSFKLKGALLAAEKLMHDLELPVHAPSSGGVESLVTLPAHTTHAFLGEDARKKLGITDDLIRYSVGLEAADDLIADLNSKL